MLLQKGVARFEHRIPKVLSPTQHAVADYITLGSLTLMTALFWKRNKRAAIAAAMCAGASATNALLKEPPGATANPINRQNHGRIDMGIAATCAAVPNLMGFEDDPEAKFFRVMAMNITTVAALTDFEAPRRRPFVAHRAA